MRLRRRGREGNRSSEAGSAAEVLLQIQSGVSPVAAVGECEAASQLCELRESGESKWHGAEEVIVVHTTARHGGQGGHGRTEITEMPKDNRVFGLVPLVQHCSCPQAGHELCAAHRI